MKTSIIVLPTYDNFEAVKQCIENIEKYTPEKHEIIVLNNYKSSDSNDYFLKHSNVKAFSDPDAKTLSELYNKAVKASDGDNILFLNNDAIVTEQWLTNMLKLFSDDSNTAIVGPMSNYIFGNQYINIIYNDVNKLNGIVKQYCVINKGDFRTVRRLENFCILIKRNKLEDMGFFNEKLKTQNYIFDELYYRAFKSDYMLKIAADSFVFTTKRASENKPDEKLKKETEEDKTYFKDSLGMDIREYIANLNSKITISLCMIVKNEEKTLARCLESVKNAVDEIVIVDTGSSDATKEIAKRYADKIYDFEWIDDFSAARNFAFEKATKEYILWLDADDVMSPDNKNKLINLKEDMDTKVDSFTMNYDLSYDLNGHVTSSLRRNRLVRRACHFRWIGAVHEYLAVWGNIIDSDIAIGHKSIEHDAERNLRIYENRLKCGEEFSPRDLFYYANELYDHRKYEKAAEFYEKFLDTGKGWIEDNIAACGKLSDCYSNLKNSEKGLFYTIKSFEYDIPRAEFCCRMGYNFYIQKRYKEAIFWYKLAIDVGRPPKTWGLINNAYYTWLPNLQLCVCYDRLGEHELACRYNEEAAKYIPDSPKIKYNREYFGKILKKSDE